MAHGPRICRLDSCVSSADVMPSLVAFIRAVEVESSPIGLVVVVVLTVVAMGVLYLSGRRAS
jgi:hypothetical protein